MLSLQPQVTRAGRIVGFTVAAALGLWAPGTRTEEPDPHAHHHPQAAGAQPTDRLRHQRHPALAFRRLPDDTDGRLLLFSHFTLMLLRARRPLLPTDEAADLITLARDIADKVLTPIVDAHEKAESYPEGVFAELGAAGLRSLSPPAEWGGRGQSFEV